MEIQIGNYGYLESDMLGRGNFGVVYKGRNVVTGEEVAVKKLDISYHRSLNFSDDDILREAEMNQQLNSNHIVKLYKVIRQREYFYFIMEYCNKGTLVSYIRDQRMSAQLCLNIIAQTSNAFIHIKERRANIIHRDIKGENILVHQRDGQIIFKIADFGLSRRVQDYVDMVQTQAGTGLYKSPQILDRRNYNYKCDVFSMGVMIFYLFFQQYPWQFLDRNRRPSEQALLANMQRLSIEQVLGSAQIQEKLQNKINEPGERRDTVDLLTQALNEALQFTEDSRIDWTQLKNLVEQDSVDSLLQKCFVVLDEFQQQLTYMAAQFTFQKLNSQQKDILTLLLQLSESILVLLSRQGHPTLPFHPSDSELVAYLKAELIAIDSRHFGPLKRNQWDYNPEYITRMRESLEQQNRGSLISVPSLLETIGLRWQVGQLVSGSEQHMRELLESGREVDLQQMNVMALLSGLTQEALCHTKLTTHILHQIQLYTNTPEQELRQQWAHFLRQ